MPIDTYTCPNCGCVGCCPNQPQTMRVVYANRLNCGVFQGVTFDMPLLAPNRWGAGLSRPPYVITAEFTCIGGRWNLQVFWDHTTDPTRTYATIAAIEPSGTPYTDGCRTPVACQPVVFSALGGSVSCGPPFFWQVLGVKVMGQCFPFETNPCGVSCPDTLIDISITGI